MKREHVIRRDPKIMGGVPVDSLVDHLKSGIRLDEFLDDFPSVSRAQAEAFLEMAEQALLEKEGDARSAG